MKLVVFFAAVCAIALFLPRANAGGVQIGAVVLSMNNLECVLGSSYNHLFDLCIIPICMDIRVQSLLRFMQTAMARFTANHKSHPPYSYLHPRIHVDLFANILTFC